MKQCGFCADDRAVSALEFAITFPFLMLLMLGGTELIRYVDAVKKTELVATSISEMISQAVPPTGSSTATVNQLDLHFSYDSTMTIFPALLKDAARKNIAWWQDIIIDYASISFTKTSNSCGTQPDQSTCYSASVVWTSTGTYGGNSRACVTPQLPTTSGTPSKYFLPSNVYGPGSLIVVDVVYTINPLIGANFFGPMRIARSVYVQPRYASLIDFDNTNNDGIASKC